MEGNNNVSKIAYLALHMRKLLLSVLAMCLMAVSYAQEPLKAARLQAQAAQDLLLNKDYKGFTQYVCPGLIKIFTTRDSLVKVTKQGVEQMEADGYKITKATIKEPFSLQTIGKEMQCLVPYTLYISAPGHTMELDSHMLGISQDKGANWTFLEIADRDRETVKMLIPTLSAKIVLPTKQQPIIKEN